MKTVEINKHNWSGESGKVKLYADGKTFAIYGDEKFKLKKKGKFEGETEWAIMGKGSDGWYETDNYGWTSDSGWSMFQNWGGDIIRETTKDPRLAAAQLMFMLF